MPRLFSVKRLFVFFVFVFQKHKQMYFCSSNLSNFKVNGSYWVVSTLIFNCITSVLCRQYMDVFYVFVWRHQGCGLGQTAALVVYPNNDNQRWPEVGPWGSQKPNSWQGCVCVSLQFCRSAVHQKLQVSLRVSLWRLHLSGPGSHSVWLWAESLQLIMWFSCVKKAYDIKLILPSFPLPEWALSSPLRPLLFTSTLFVKGQTTFPRSVLPSSSPLRLHQLQLHLPSSSSPSHMANKEPVILFSSPCLSNLSSSCQRSQHSSFITSSHHSSFLSLTLTPHVKGQLCVAPAYWSPHLEMILINKAGSPFEASPPARLEKTHIDSLGLVPLLMSHFKLSDLGGFN